MKLTGALFVNVLAIVVGCYTGLFLMAHMLPLGQVLNIITFAGLFLAGVAQICGQSKWVMWIGVPLQFACALLLVQDLGFIVGPLVGVALVVTFVSVLCTLLPEPTPGKRRAY